MERELSVPDRCFSLWAVISYPFYQPAWPGARLVHRRGRRGNATTSRLIIDKIFLKIPGHGRGLRLNGETLFHFARLFIDKAEQDMVSSHALAHMTNARMFGLHPGVDQLLQRVHTVATASAIKAFKFVHFFILSR